MFEWNELPNKRICVSVKTTDEIAFQFYCLHGSLFISVKTNILLTKGKIMSRRTVIRGLK